MKINQKLKAFTAVLMATVMLATFAACKKDTEANPKPDLTPSVEDASDALEQPKLKLSKKVTDLKKKNADVVGWLEIPGTTINEAVAYSKDNANYLRTTVEKKWDYFGAYFTDMDNIGIKKGTRADLEKNTILYGHSVYNGVKNPTFWLGHNIPDFGVDKVPVDYKDGEKFAQLYKYVDADFAKKNPYIYFSTDKEEMVWEIFAAYYTDTKMPFNSKASMTNEKDFMAVVNESIAKSVHNFNVKVDKDDKIITLSTCSYIEGPNVKDLRFHVAAKLVDKDAKIKKEAKITKNTDKLDYRKNLPAA
ncbi:MAG: class B sortase [Oscillospiraceae bacterium]